MSFVTGCRGRFILDYPWMNWPTYSHIRNKHDTLLQRTYMVPDFEVEFIAKCELNACGIFSVKVFLATLGSVFV